jgi:hypothetical protein
MTKWLKKAKTKIVTCDETDKLSKAFDTLFDIKL